MLGRNICFQRNFQIWICFKVNWGTDSLNRIWNSDQSSKFVNRILHSFYQNDLALKSLSNFQFISTLINIDFTYSFFRLVLKPCDIYFVSFFTRSAQYNSKAIKIWKILFMIAFYNINHKVILLNLVRIIFGKLCLNTYSCRRQITYLINKSWQIREYFHKYCF